MTATRAVSLQLHAGSACPPAQTIAVLLARHGSTLTLTYVVAGAISDLILPAPEAPERTDELWRSTCFEAFVRGPDEAYLEFNLAPSTRWAAYAFDRYRAGMRNAEVTAPRIETRREARKFTLATTLELPDNAQALALSAIIETRDGGKAYWALAHPAGKPDFHHAAGFVFALGDGA